MAIYRVFRGARNNPPFVGIFHQCSIALKAFRGKL
jgi:hypothetical protein